MQFSFASGSKESIVLFEITGFSIKEIVEIQDDSVSSVKQRLRRGRERLEKILTLAENKETEGMI